MKETFKTEKYTADIFFLVLDKILNTSVNLRFPPALENRMKNNLSLIFYEWKYRSLKANNEKSTYFVLSHLARKTTCIKHRLCLYYTSQLARGPFSGPNGTKQSSDHVYLIKLDPYAKMSLIHTAA